MTDIREALDGREFHELCMAYRAADPRRAAEAFTALQGFIRSAAAAQAGEPWDSIKHLLDGTPTAVRACPGGGKEDLLASLCTTFMALRERAGAAPIAPAGPGSAGFEGWFARNYNGEVVFHDPAWHARRIYPVAVWHARQSLQRPTDREQALQARIDELMLEHCPDDMTQAQRDEWARHQQPVSADMQAELDAAMPHAPRCDRPPAGWRCTRQKGHSGPCATYPDSAAARASPIGVLMTTDAGMPDDAPTVPVTELAALFGAIRRLVARPSPLLLQAIARAEDAASASAASDRRRR